jgi:hypothetical protein
MFNKNCSWSLCIEKKNMYKMFGGVW